MTKNKNKNKNKINSNNLTTQRNIKNNNEENSLKILEEEENKEIKEEIKEKEIEKEEIKENENELEIRNEIVVNNDNKTIIDSNINENTNTNDNNTVTTNDTTAESTTNTTTTTNDTTTNITPISESKKKKNKKKKKTQNEDNLINNEEEIEQNKTQENSTEITSQLVNENENEIQSNITSTIDEVPEIIDLEQTNKEIINEIFEDSSNSTNLDHIMTEMKKSLSTNNTTEIINLVNRIASPTEQVEILPLDSFTEPLAKGETMLTHGLVIPCGWSWCNTSNTISIYTELLDRIRNLEENVSPSNRICYLYQATELHCTVATLSSFKEKNSYFSSLYNLENNHGASERLEVMSLWKTALQDYFLTHSNSFFTETGSFMATVERIEVCDTAIIFHIECSNAMVLMREAIKSICEHQLFREYEIINGLSPYELTRLVHIPNITHSTFVRFRQKPSPELRKSLEDIVSTWVPLNVEMNGMKIVYENRPYMHLDLNDTTILDVFPLPIQKKKQIIIELDDPNEEPPLIINNSQEKQPQEKLILINEEEEEEKTVEKEKIIEEEKIVEEEEEVIIEEEEKEEENIKIIEVEQIVEVEQNIEEIKEEEEIKEKEEEIEITQSIKTIEEPIIHIQENQKAELIEIEEEIKELEEEIKEKNVEIEKLTEELIESIIHIKEDIQEEKQHNIQEVVIENNQPIEITKSSPQVEELQTTSIKVNEPIKEIKQSEELKTDIKIEEKKGIEKPIEVKKEIVSNKNTQISRNELKQQTTSSQSQSQPKPKLSSESNSTKYSNASLNDNESSSISTYAMLAFGLAIVATGTFLFMRKK